MTFINLTRADAERIRDATKLLEQNETAEAKAIQDGKIQVAVDWWNTVKPAIPSTRDEALIAYNVIKELLKTETAHYRLAVLRIKLNEANDKFKEMKKLGTTI